MNGFSIPEPPTPDTYHALDIRFTGDQEAMDPGTQDAVEAEISKRLREAGVTEKHTDLTQEHTYSRDRDRLTSVHINLRESSLSIDQLSKARRAAIAVLRDYGVTAQPENVTVIAQSPINLGGL